MAPCCHEALQSHNGPLVPHSVTMVSMIPWGLAMPQWSPWIHGALQNHNGPWAAPGPGMQQWPLGSTKPCCFTLGPWHHAVQQDHSDVLGSMRSHSVKMVPCFHTAQQCHNNVRGSTGSPQCHNNLLGPWCPHSVTMALSFQNTPHVTMVSKVLHGAPQFPHGLHRKESMNPPCFMAS